MTTDPEVLDFYAKMTSEIRDRALGGDAKTPADFKENVFTEWLLEFFEENGITNNSSVVYYEGQALGGRVKINAYGLSDDGDRVDLFVVAYMEEETPVMLGKTELRKLAMQAARFFVAATKGFHEKMEASSEPAGAAKHMHKASRGIQDIRLFILTDGLVKARKPEPKDFHGWRVRFEIWDLQRIFRAMQAGLARDEIIVDFVELSGASLPCVEMPGINREYSACLAIIPGQILYSLYDQYGARLLEFNVRSFLSTRGKINQGIRRTLKEEPERFMAYNNGIVVTVDHMETKRDQNGAMVITRLRGFQVVNGGQTTASIHRAHKLDKININSVQVPAKITVIDPGRQQEIVRQISRFANTQNVVQMADFSSNEPFHVKLEELSRTTWCPGEQGRWFYERARGQYQDEKARATTKTKKQNFNKRTPTSRKFTKTDLAKYMNSWEQKPNIVSYGAQKNFNYFMQALREEHGHEWLPDVKFYKELIAKAILFKQTDKIAKQEKFPAYKANIVTYTVACLSYQTRKQLDLEKIWSNQSLSDELIALLRKWTHEVYDGILASARGRNVTEWCKKEDCWKELKALNLELPRTMPPEMSILSGKAN